MSLFNSSFIIKYYKYSINSLNKFPPHFPLPQHPGVPGVEIQVDPGKQRFAQLYLVDLAGSERVMKTGVQGLQLEEVTRPWALVKDGERWWD